ncbi:LOW QUALITY PROTEIN: hypothetical protein ACHAWF_014479 [Thalassiosira exigua]
MVATATSPRSDFGSTPPSNIPKHLRKAAGSKDPAALPSFLRDHPSLTVADLDCTLYDGRAALHMACWTGAVSNVSLLLDMGCDIDAIATRSHNYGKSPIFFACVLAIAPLIERTVRVLDHIIFLYFSTRGRRDVVELLLDRGANVLIVNNKGQSVYSIACSHFETDVVQRIKQAEIDQGSDKDLLGWVDYKKTHPDGNVYGDLDLRFLGRPVMESDLVKDGVVNPTTKESRRGNFARNNPHVYNSRKKREASKAKKQKPAVAQVRLTEDERMEKDAFWDKVHSSLQACDSWGVFSSLLSIVQFMEGKKTKSPWVVESASRLNFLVRLEETLGEIALDSSIGAPPADFKQVLSEAVVFCGSGDRQVSLVKRILANAREYPSAKATEKGLKYHMSQQEMAQLEQFWSDAEAAVMKENSRDFFVSLMKVIVLSDSKGTQWLKECTTQLHNLLGTDSSMGDSLFRETMDYCVKNEDKRNVSLLKRMLTRSIVVESESTDGTVQSSEVENRKPRRTTKSLPDHYHSAIESLQISVLEKSVMPSWAVLMPSSRSDNSEPNYLTLPHRPKWIDSPTDLQSLQSLLSNHSCNENHLCKLIAFDSEFRSENGSTKLATIQFSILDGGIPFAWVVDLHPDPSDITYSTLTCDVLRWLFLESDAHLLGFAHKQDIHMISSFIGEDIPMTPNFLDVQLLALHKMSEHQGSDFDMSSLPSLKTSCAYFLESSKSSSSNIEETDAHSSWTSWELSKEEQCSDWARRPLTVNQLDYAGLDAAVLLILLAEIIRS